ncbi:MAG: trypsin-like peptidase domain-containing protein [Selenomonadaceae bacterium]|nr:trypsin-like peptidase domain-containing protein [Selenomonadaceae bacterium]
MTKKKLTKLVCAAVASATLIFGGCSPVAEDEKPVTNEENTAVTTATENNATKDNVINTSTASAAKISANVNSSARNTPVVQVAKNVGPAVVGITNKAVARDWFNRPVETEGVGSGVIFRSDGYIVTNNHVIEGAREIIVSLSDGNTINGTLVGTDEMTDIAVVKVDAQNLPTAHFGNSDEIMVGEPVVAIGNPMGLEFQGSVTVGVISALNRTIELNDRRFNLLQTDAAISPGNSGGALVNYDSEVIGINSAKLAQTEVEGIAFAIPINTVQAVVNEIMDKGYVSRPYLGVVLFDKATAARYGYQLNIDKGVFIFQVALDSPAGRAGLQRGDIILKVDGKEYNSASDLRNDIAGRKIGDTITITYDRDGVEHTIEITLREMPQSSN